MFNSRTISNLKMNTKMKKILMMATSRKRNSRKSTPAFLNLRRETNRLGSKRETSNKLMKRAAMMTHLTMNLLLAISTFTSQL